MVAAEFDAFATKIGLPLEPFQRQIADAVFDPAARIVLVGLPRGNGKTALLAALTTFHLATTARPEAVVAAASREQGSILFRYAQQYAEHPDLAGHITVRHQRMRTSDGGTLLLLPSNGLRQHGLTPTFGVADEVHAWRDNSEAMEALTSSLVKRPDSTLVIISSAGQGDTSTLGQLRKRALALPNVHRDGALVDCRGDSMRALLWELPDDADVDDPAVVKTCNPASWITEADLARQREAVPDLAFRRYHAGQWTQREGAWLPAGAWQAAVTNPVIEPGEPLWVALDVGGTESATALTWATADLRVGCWIETREDAILDAVEKVRELREQHEIKRFIYDPWRARQAALELQADGIECVELPQSDVRMCPASANLRSAVVEQRVQLPSHPDLAEHAANAVARHSRRGWRLASPARNVPIDGTVSLAMLVEDIEQTPPPSELVVHGFL